MLGMGLPTIGWRTRYAQCRPGEWVDTLRSWLNAAEAAKMRRKLSAKVDGPVDAVDGAPHWLADR